MVKEKKSLKRHSERKGWSLKRHILSFNGRWVGQLYPSGAMHFSRNTIKSARSQDKSDKIFKKRYWWFEVRR